MDGTRALLLHRRVHNSQQFNHEFTNGPAKLRAAFTYRCNRSVVAIPHDWHVDRRKEFANAYSTLNSFIENFNPKKPLGASVTVTLNNAHAVPQQFPQSAADKLLAQNASLKPLVELAKWMCEKPSSVCTSAAKRELETNQDRVRRLLREVLRHESVTSLVPTGLSHLLRGIVEKFKSSQDTCITFTEMRAVQEFSLEFFQALITVQQPPSISSHVRVLLIDLFELILTRYDTVRTMILHDETPPAQPIPNSYHPTKTGQAIYFRPDGLRLRTKRRVHGLDDSADGDGEKDTAVEFDGRCSKTFAASKGHSYMMFWLCPMHGHCWGFSTIYGNEGRKDVHDVLYEYLEKAPKTVFYDFACRCVALYSIVQVGLFMIKFLLSTIYRTLSYCVIYFCQFPLSFCIPFNV